MNMEQRQHIPFELFVVHVNDKAVKHYASNEMVCDIFSLCLCACVCVCIWHKIICCVQFTVERLRLLPLRLTHIHIHKPIFRLWLSRMPTCHIPTFRHQFFHFCKVCHSLVHIFVLETHTLCVLAAGEYNIIIIVVCVKRNFAIEQNIELIRTALKTESSRTAHSQPNPANTQCTGKAFMYH